jgi:hypothetical protein
MNSEQLLRLISYSLPPSVRNTPQHYRFQKRYPLVLRFGGGTRKSRPPPLDYPKATEKGTLQNLDENHSGEFRQSHLAREFCTKPSQFFAAPNVRNPACP